MIFRISTVSPFFSLASMGFWVVLTRSTSPDNGAWFLRSTLLGGVSIDSCA